MGGRGSPASAHKKKRSIAGIALVKEKNYSHPGSPVSLSGGGGAGDGVCVPCMPSPKNRRLEWTMAAEANDSFGSNDSLDMLTVSQRIPQRPSSAGVNDFSSNYFLPSKNDTKRLTFQETVALFQSFTVGMRKDLMDLFTEWSIPIPANVKAIASPLPDRLATPNNSGVFGGGVHELSASTVERVVTTTNLIQFIETQQLESCSPEAAKELVQRFETDPILRNNYLLSYEGFAAFMNDAANFAFRSENLAPIEEDMNYPLSHYYIASSHNTYLTGHQLKGIIFIISLIYFNYLT